ncbi:hypothetical protein QYF50_15400 [Paenibacillus vini]|uniref:hypothetical protein n=1 Tax=Paenibacillus vini TaxID=1476024 RepID=UPI0025B640C2|nr:hypothetical protein [Paenibacillus vini]MDN4069237.1 hypothetical protein [Paenibacillus vini]MDN4069290.1 hypothetical protein [Paenibacillus vini]
MATKMQESSVGEALHLFEVLEKYNVGCSVELKRDGQGDPFVTVASQPVKAEYFESIGGGDNGDLLVVCLGESEFAFELNLSIGKDITESQISLCLAGTNYAAWFNSDGVPAEGIKEALNYKEHSDNDRFDAHEVALIEFIRGLEFEDLLDAFEALKESSSAAIKMSSEKVKSNEIAIAQGWQERSFKLIQLAELLADSNADYRSHIYPEDTNDEQ